MASNSKDLSIRLQNVIEDLTNDYERARNLFDKSGLDANLKENSLQAMANAMQLTNAAIQNYANWKHVLREDYKTYNKKK